ncbi:MAG: rhodanese-like domain-containing protein [Chthoniobacterales bacterium]|nr:rhodanese-like domain-containing protein [Chthoniobacterales bacterium]
MKFVKPEQVASITNAFILDVRIPAEYRAMNIPGSILHPMHELNPDKIKSMLNGNTCYVLCRSGIRAEEAAKKLHQAGIADVAVIEGGILAWEKAGLPVNRGQTALPLERQVRIVAGLMALAGAILAWYFNPLWVILSGFVGCGLIFAGITGYCPMANLIAKMPWNNPQVISSCCSQQTSQQKKETTSSSCCCS